MSLKAKGMNRRVFFTSSTKAMATVAAGSLVTNADLEAISGNVNTNSQPSELKITDLRITSIRNRHILKLYTNQDICGYGELRDGSSPTYALMLKSRILGMNPCNVDKIFRKLKQFGFHARQSAGPVAIEEACWDLAGKAWGVPCWQMLGGKFRDRILVYADTRWTEDPVEMGNRLKARMVEHGFRYLKADIRIETLRGIEGALSYPQNGQDPFSQGERVMHPFTGIRITEKGLKSYEDYVATVRDIIGWEIPLASDHYGHFGVEDAIKFAQTMDQFNLAWLEDLVPWQFTDHYIRIKNSCTTPILTGEDIYLLDGFRDLIDRDAVSMIHPDPATSGGLLETKKIGDYAMKHGISMALHMAGMPVTMFSAVHIAAATENFVAMEHHNVDDDWYGNLVTGPVKPLMQDGFVPVPNTPGLGIELNEEAVREHMNPGTEYFGSTDEWNDDKANDRLWSMYPASQGKSRDWWEKS